MVHSEPEADNEHTPLPGRIRGVNPERLATQAENKAQPVPLAGKRPDGYAGKK